MNSAAETFAVATRAAAGTDVSTHCRVISHLGTEALICYRVEEAEDTRRSQIGAGAIRSVEVLELLLSLPVGAAVSVADLTDRERAALPKAPPGTVTATGGTVVRHATAPVSVQLAVVAAQTWRSGLVTAGRFTPFCSPAVVLPTRPTDLADMSMEADFYGVGIGVVEDGRAEILVEPAPFVRRRYTAAGWQFLEAVYGARR